MSKSKHVAAERAAWIKRRAKELGFTSVGISVARELTEEAPRLETWLKEGMHGEMAYMEGHFDKRLDPRKLLPGTKSGVSLLFNYHNPHRQSDPEAPKISLIFVKLGIRLKTSSLNESNFDKFSFLPNLFKIKLNIFQSSIASPIG